jgi:hypothetical protein
VIGPFAFMLLLRLNQCFRYNCSSTHLRLASEWRRVGTGTNMKSGRLKTVTVHFKERRQARGTQVGALTDVTAMCCIHVRITLR